MSLLNRCIFTAASSGTGNFVVSAAATGFLTPAQSGAVDGLTYSYAAETTSGGAITAWEVGQGVYHSGTTTLDRTTVLFSSNANAVVSFGSAPNVMITALKEDFKTLNNAETVTTSKPILDLSQTWNAGGVTFTALKLNVTSTASATASLMMDLQVASSSVFSVRKDGRTTIPGDFVGNNFFDSNDVVSVGTSGAVGLPGIFAGSIRTIGFTDGGGGTGSFDTGFRRDAAGILAQRNGTNAQTLRVYNTYTDASNYERGVFDWTTTSNVLTIGVQAAGTGSNRSVAFATPHVNQNFQFTKAGISYQILGRDSGTGAAGLFLEGSAGGIQWAPGALPAIGTALSFDADVGINRVAAFVLKINDGQAGSGATGWLNWGGQKRVTSDQAFTSTTTLADVTGLSVNVQAGRTYSFEAFLSFTDAAAGGIRAAISGTCTATAIEQCGWVFDASGGTSVFFGRTTALASAPVNQVTTGTSGGVQMKGTITVNAAGTLKVQAAQSVSSATATTIKQGSYFIVYDMP